MDFKKYSTIIERFVKSDAFKSFSSLYFLRTGHRLETVEQLIDAISYEIITPQDLFDEHIEGLDFTQEQEDFWLSNLDMFDFSNYFPSPEKELENGKGAWIKVRTENGYQIHFARKATRKIKLQDNYISQSERLLKSINKTLEGNTLEDISSIRSKSLKASILAIIGFQPYEVWYWRTKTQKVYVTPYEYEIVDINEYVDYIKNKSLKGVVKVRSLFTSRNKDKIFYLRSRGLSEELAKIYANLESCYFDVNLKTAINEYAKVNNKAIKKAFS